MILTWREIRALRKASGIKQYDFADLMRVKIGSWSTYETGNYTPPPKKDKLLRERSTQHFIDLGIFGDEEILEQAREELKQAGIESVNLYRKEDKKKKDELYSVWHNGQEYSFNKQEEVSQFMKEIEDEYTEAVPYDVELPESHLNVMFETRVDEEHPEDAYVRQETEIEAEVEEDAINKPEHYHHGGIDVIQFAQMKLPKEQLIGFFRINVLKYITRYDKKQGIEDLRKAKFYLEKLVEEMESE